LVCQDETCGAWFLGLRGSKYCEDHRTLHLGATRRRHPRKKYDWTPERDAYLREHYNSRVKGRAAVIAARFGFPTWLVKRRAGMLGVAAPKPADLGRVWSAEEIAIVEEWTGRRSVKWIVGALKRRGFTRTQTSVIVRQKRLGISRRISEGYTMRELESALGMDHRRIERLVREGKLRGIARGADTTLLPGHAWHFSEETVMAFLRDHRTAYRLDRVDQTWFLGLVFDQYAHAELRDAERKKASAA